MIAVDENVIRYFLYHPFPDNTAVYREVWYDEEGLAVKMDPHGGTLRHSIRGDVQLGERDWLQIMYGIAQRLVWTHGQGVFHGDLKPSNGICKQGSRLIL